MPTCAQRLRGYGFRLWGPAACLLFACLYGHAFSAEEERPPFPGREYSINSSVSASSVICRVVILDEGISEQIGYRTYIRQSARVVSVFYGDPELQTVRLREKYEGLAKGDELVLFLDASRHARLVKAIPDTPENRERVVSALKARDEKRRKLSLTDMDAYLTEGEKLIREFLAALAKKLPDHRCLGEEAIKKLEIRRCPRPAGLYLRIEGNLVSTETNLGTLRLPQGDGLILWVGFHSLVQCPQIGHARTRSTHRKGSEPLVLCRGGRLSSGGLQYALILPLGKEDLAEQVHLAFHSVRKSCEKLWRNPPLDIEAAVECICQRAEALRKSLRKEKPAVPGTPSGLPIEVHDSSLLTDVNSRLYLAFRALQTEFGEKHLSEDQKRRLIPALIDLLTDHAMVLNETPCDGPMVLCHQMAYPLLVKLTGKKFPAPLLSRPRWPSALPGFPPKQSPKPPQSPKESLAEMKKRLETWRSWWEREAKQEPKK